MWSAPFGRRGLSLFASREAHHRLEHSGDPSRTTTVPVHASKTLKRGTLHGIIKQAGFTIDEFVALL
jgi:predicted RNA binding protein YcfA (HicA-like mRNA interferase family)